MNILVLNCGSSSVKFQLVETFSVSTANHADRKLAIGLVDRLGRDATLKIELAGENTGRAEKIAAPDHEAAVRLIIDQLGLAGAGGDSRSLDALGHRVLHGGDLFASAVAIDDSNLAKIESLNDLAPLH